MYVRHRGNVGDDDDDLTAAALPAFAPQLTNHLGGWPTTQPSLHFWQARLLSNYRQGRPNFAWVINFKFNNRISTHVKQLSWQKSLCWIILRACVGVTTFLLRHSTASRDHTLLAFFQPAFWSTQISTLPFWTFLRWNCEIWRKTKSRFTVGFTVGANSNTKGVHH